MSTTPEIVHKPEIGPTPEIGPRLVRASSSSYQGDGDTPPIVGLVGKQSMENITATISPEQKKVLSKTTVYTKSSDLSGTGQTLTGHAIETENTRYLWIGRGLKILGFLGMAGGIQLLLAGSAAAGAIIGIGGFVAILVGERVEEASKPYIEGQPPGIYNGQLYCWLIALIQLHARFPKLREAVQNLPETKAHVKVLKGILETLAQDKVDARRKSRVNIGTLTFGNLDPNQMQDPSEGFKLLHVSSPKGNIEIEECKNGKVKNASHDSKNTYSEYFAIPIDIPREIPDFENLLKTYFDDSVTETQKNQKTGEEETISQYEVKRKIKNGSPEELILDFKRFRPIVGNWERYEKIDSPLPLPLKFQFPKEYIADAEFSPEYECDAFIVHKGFSLTSGHYVIYIKHELPDKNGKAIWFLCDDATVSRASEQEINRELLKAYLCHYSRSVTP